MPIESLSPSERLEFSRHQLSQRLDELSRTPYVDYPYLVQLETLALCPAACSFCAYPNLRRKGARMDESLIDKLISDLKDMPADLPFLFAPFKINEPFADVRLLPLLRRVERELPRARSLLYSNAAPLTERVLYELSELDRVDRLNLSINEFQRDKYEAVMQLPYERTIERLRLLHRLKCSGRILFDVVLTRVGDGSPDDAAFVVWCMINFPAFKAAYSPRARWTDQDAPGEALAPIPDVGCGRWFEVSIDAEGKVALCCMDGQSDWTLGDVRTQHLLEIYNQPGQRRLRLEALSRRSLGSPCNHCDYTGMI